MGLWVEGDLSRLVMVGCAGSVGSVLVDASAFFGFLVAEALRFFVSCCKALQTWLRALTTLFSQMMRVDVGSLVEDW